jgi:hypothetical protein
MVSPIIPKLGYYLDLETGSTIVIDKVICGHNEIYGLMQGLQVISDHNTTDQYKYLGLKGGEQ